MSTDAQDLTAQRDALAALGGPPERLYVDHGLTGTTEEAAARQLRTAADQSRSTCFGRLTSTA